MVLLFQMGDRSATSPWRRRVALSRPFAGMVMFLGTVYIGSWWLTPLVMFAIFVAVVMVTHDVVHRWRVRFALEAVVPILASAVGVLSLPRFPGILIYVTMAIVGSRVYPLLTVYLPRHGYGAMPLSLTRTLWRRILPAIFLELAYRLGHHLQKLGRRLDPHLAAAGVRPVRVP